MRQAGIIAAAGFVALNSMINRLAEDHDNAKQLAVGLSKLNGIQVNQKTVCTNMVYCTLEKETIEDNVFLEKAQQKNLKFFSTTFRTFRMVTHHGINKEDINTAVSIITNILNE